MKIGLWIIQIDVFLNFKKASRAPSNVKNVCGRPIEIYVYIMLYILDSDLNSILLYFNSVCHELL